MIGTLTKSETATLLQGLTKRNKLTHESYEAVMGWAANAKLDSDLLVLVLQRYVELDIDEQSGELRWIPTELGLSGPRRYELERMRV